MIWRNSERDLEIAMMKNAIHGPKKPVSLCYCHCHCHCLCRCCCSVCNVTMFLKSALLLLLLFLRRKFTCTQNKIISTLILTRHLFFLKFDNGRTDIQTDSKIEIRCATVLRLRYMTTRQL